MEQWVQFYKMETFETFRKLESAMYNGLVNQAEAKLIAGG